MGVVVALADALVGFGEEYVHAFSSPGYLGNFHVPVDTLVHISALDPISHLGHYVTKVEAEPPKRAGGPSWDHYGRCLPHHTAHGASSRPALVAGCSSRTVADIVD